MPYFVIPYLVIYDGNCNLCVTLVQLLERLDRGQQFRYIAMQQTDRLAELAITPADCEAGMILLHPDRPDERWQGSDAAEEIGRRLPLGQIFVTAYRRMPGLKAGGDRLYTQIRDHRYQLFGGRSNTYESAYPACSSCTEKFS